MNTLRPRPVSPMFLQHLHFRCLLAQPRFGPSAQPFAGPRAAGLLAFASPSAAYSSKPAPTASDDQLRTARAWLANLHADTIPIGNFSDLTFSRSSGPGGQNVNKVSSKATLKVPLDQLLLHVPTALHAEIKRSRYLAQRSNALIIQADDSRKQSDNAQACYRRLYDAIKEAGRTAVPNEASASQVHRVKELQKADNEHRLKSKKFQSSKKAFRRGRGDE